MGECSVQKKGGDFPAMYCIRQMRVENRRVRIWKRGGWGRVGASRHDPPSDPGQSRGDKGKNQRSTAII